MIIFTYLKESKNRGLIVIITIVLNITLCFIYQEQIIYLLSQHQKTLYPYFITTNLTEVFYSIIKVSFFLGFYLSYPSIIHQAWFFLIPALYKYEYKIISKFLLQSIILYIISTLLVYYILLPYCWNFFTSFDFNTENTLVNIHLETKLKEYLDFFFILIYTTNIFFHILLIFVLLMKNFKLKSLIKKRKILYILLFFTATIFTPPDILSQLITAITLLTAYELFIIYIFIKNEYKRANNGT